MSESHPLELSQKINQKLIKKWRSRGHVPSWAILYSRSHDTTRGDSDNVAILPIIEEREFCSLAIKLWQSGAINLPLSEHAPAGRAIVVNCSLNGLKVLSLTRRVYKKRVRSQRQHFSLVFS